MTTVSLEKLDKRAILRLFIQCYRDEPALWNKNLKEYYDRDKKAEGYFKLIALYQNIEKNATLEDVKRKINIMRTVYKRDAKKVQQAKLSGQCVSKSWLYKEFSFLTDYYDKTPHNGNLKSEKSNNSEDDPLVWEFSYVDDLPTYGVSSDSDSNEAGHLAKRKKSSQSSSDNNEMNMKHNDTEEDSVAKNWACKLFKLNKDQKIWAEKFINDILTEGELGTLHRHSVSFNY